MIGLHSQSVALPSAAERGHDFVQFLASQTQLSAGQLKVNPPVTAQTGFKLRLGDQELILPGKIARRK